MKALYIASTGMSAQERNVEVISNNIANMRTTGFKRQRIEFQDLLYQIYRRAGSLTSDGGTQVPVGVEVGSGVKTAATSRIMSQGSVEVTNKDLDVAIRGEGYFIVNLPDGRTAYTRDGSFERNSSGELVTIDGYEVQPGIVIPDTARSVSISDDGVVHTAGHQLECPLCWLTVAPPPDMHIALLPQPVASPARPSVLRSPLAARTAPPLPARGPPAFS